MRALARGAAAAPLGRQPTRTDSRRAQPIGQPALNRVAHHSRTGPCWGGGASAAAASICPLHISLLAFETLTLRLRTRFPQCCPAAAAATAAAARLARRGDRRRVAAPETKDMTRSANKHANTKGALPCAPFSAPFSLCPTAGCE